MPLPTHEVGHTVTDNRPVTDVYNRRRPTSAEVESILKCLLWCISNTRSGQQSIFYKARQSVLVPGGLTQVQASHSALLFEAYKRENYRE